MMIHKKSKRQPMKMELLFGIVYSGLLITLFTGPTVATTLGIIPDPQHSDIEKVGEVQHSYPESDEDDK